MAAAVAGLLMPASLLVAPAFAAEVSPKVVNGREPGPSEVTSLVYVRAGGSLCSGTLVDTTHVITAGHCVATGPGSVRSPGSFTIGWTPTGMLPPTVWVGVSRVDLHPAYDARTFANDIAVLTLTTPIAGAKPMALATSAVSRTALAAGASVQAAGYGYTSARGPISDRALVADLTVVPNRVCRDDVEAYSIGGVSFVGLKVDTATAVCAIGVRPESRLIIDTCQGDSGGPLYAGTGSGQRLLGLVSVGVGCAGFDNRNGQLEELADKTPGIYTRITPYLDWLALVGVRSAPSAPVITATSVAEGIRVVFAPGDTAAVQGYRAEATDGDTRAQCTADAAAATCTITGLEAGATYTIVGYALGQQAESPASAPVSAIAGIPVARPDKPRIASVKATPAGRIAIIVDRIDSAPWTTTFVVCSAGGATYRVDVVAGKAVVAVPGGQTYRCYAKSTNAVGGMRSKPVRIDV